MKKAETDAAKQKEELAAQQAKLDDAGNVLDDSIKHMVETQVEGGADAIAVVKAAKAAKGSAPKPAVTKTKAAAKTATQSAADPPASPSKPKLTAVEFMRRLDGKPAGLADYLTQIPAATLPKLITNRLEADHVVKFIDAASEMAPAAAFEALRGLVKVKRFEMTTMFLSDEDREAAALVFAKIVAAAAAGELGASVTTDTIAQVASKFE